MRKIIINEAFSLGGFVNEITKELDNITTEKIDGFHNYIHTEPIGNKWVIRYPGSSNGHIKVDESIITEIKIYKNSFRDIYEKDAELKLQKYVGCTFVMST